MYSASPPPFRAERLLTLLTLITGSEPAAAAIERALARNGGRIGARTEALPREQLGEVLRGAAGRADGDGSLGPSERLALVLARVSGLSEEEAAEVAGVAPERFRQQLEAAEQALADGVNRRAVVLEDHVLAREALVEQSREEGLAVVTATGTQEAAVAAAATFSPAIAMVDIDLHGAELAGDLAAMRIREAAPGCHVLFVTGYTEAERMAELMQNAGALIKPFRSQDFAAAIRAALPRL